MPDTFLLERVYLAADRQHDTRIERVIGALLDAAFRDPRPSPEIDGLCARLGRSPGRADRN